MFGLAIWACINTDTTKSIKLNCIGTILRACVNAVILQVCEDSLPRE